MKLILTIIVAVSFSMTNLYATSKSGQCSVIETLESDIDLLSPKDSELRYSNIKSLRQLRTKLLRLANEIDDSYNNGEFYPCFTTKDNILDLNQALKQRIKMINRIFADIKLISNIESQKQ